MKIKEKLAEDLDTGKVSKSSLLRQINETQVEINIEKIRESANIFFATPCYGGNLTDQFFLSMIRTSQMFMQHQLAFRITTLRNESLITRGRNILTAMFLESNCSHLMFIDADIEFQPESVLKLIAADKEIAVGAYSKKVYPPQVVVNYKFTNPEKTKLNVENGLVEILDGGTGFMLIKRTVFEKMMSAYPEMHYKNDTSINNAEFNKYCYAFFDTGIDQKDRRYLSEDYYFNRLWQKLNGSVWLDPTIKLNHVGSFTYETDMKQLLNI